MGKFNGVLLASDFDNTLVYTERALRSGGEIPELSAKNRAAIECFMREGGYFAIATGRALPGFISFAPGIPMNAPGVVCNGAAIYDFQKNEYIEAALLQESAREQGQELLNRFPAVACEAYHIENVIHAVQPNEITRRHQHMTHVDVMEEPSLRDVPLPLGKLLFEGTHEDLLAAQAFLKERGWAENYELIFSSPFLLEMTAKGANKGGMVKKLAAYLGVAAQNIYCVGDEANDLSMLAVSAIPFAPANCVPAVRESGAYLVAHAEQDAVADVIGILDGRY